MPSQYININNNLAKYKDMKKNAEIENRRKKKWKKKCRKDEKQKKELCKLIENWI